MLSQHSSVVLPEAVRQDIERYLALYCPNYAAHLTIDVAANTSSSSYEQNLRLITTDQGQPQLLEQFALPVALPQLLQAVARWQAMRAQRVPLSVESGCWLDVNRRVICSASAEVLLTDKETLLLQELVQAAPETLSRSQLLESVWRYDEQVESHTLESHIYRLRQKLEPLALAQQLTTTTQGYCWV